MENNILSINIKLNTRDIIFGAIRYIPIQRNILSNGEMVTAITYQRHFISKGTLNGDTTEIYGIGHFNSDFNNRGSVIVNYIYEENVDKMGFKIDRHGNLIKEEKISVFEALTGTTLNIHHPDGRRLTINIPPIIESCERTIIGYGLPQNGKSSTDLIIHFIIVHPIINKEQIDLIKKNLVHITESLKSQIL